MSESDDSRIERLRKALYSKSTNIEVPHLLDLKKHKTEVSTDWQKEEPEKTAPIDINSEYDVARVKKSRLIRIMLEGAAVFFLLSIAFAAFVLFKGVNVISPNKIELNIVAPASIPSGQAASLDISLTNQNSSSLQLVDVILNYPQGTRSADDQSQELTQDRVSFDSIAPGQTVEGASRAIFFGEDGTTEKINIEIDYRVFGSNTVFTKNSEYDVAIGTAALSLTLDSDSQVTSGQNINMTLTAKSNSSSVVKDVLLQAAFPFGFTLSSSTPSVLPQNNNTWDLGDIEPGGERTVKISGVVTGEQDEVRFFRFTLGLGSSDNQNSLQTLVASAENQLVVQKPFIGTDVVLNGQSSDGYIMTMGGQINGTINWQNNLDVPVSNLQILTTVKGDVLDPNSFSAADGGIVRSDAGTFSWSQFEEDALANVTPGQNGALNFSLSTLPISSSALSNVRNPSVSININIKGRIISDANLPEDINSAFSKNIPVNTYATVDAQVVHSIGPFTNTGALPPKVNQPTEYTIIWTASNMFNDLDNAKVTATLPNFVTWTGVTSPAAEQISFDPTSRQITWNLGTLLATGGSASGLRQVDFQIAFTPSNNQAGQNPLLMNDAVLSGTDSFTNQNLSFTSGDTSLSMPTDPAFNNGDDVVTN